MAYVTGPLMSQSASGQIAKQLIFQTYNGRSYAKAYAVPGNTPGHSKMNQTPAQLAVQSLTKSLMQNWKTINPADQATWDALSEPKRISRVNAYLRYNYARNAIGLPPMTYYPPPPMTLVYSGGTVTPETGQVGLTYNGNPGIAVIWNNSMFFTSPNKITAIYFGQPELDGEITLEGEFSSLTNLNLSNNTGRTTAPTLTALKTLQYLSLAGSAITTAPDLSGLTNLMMVNCINTHLAEVDSIFNTMATTVNLGTAGTVNVSGGTSAAPTSASAAARTALSTGAGHWILITN